ncbi:MAG: hypothetical protein JWM11_8066, partial [Planctomycetaceae bacterium]|nr:hypothetical protein [Planctomycetaceae bacterium]
MIEELVPLEKDHCQLGQLDLLAGRHGFGGMTGGGGRAGLDLDEDNEVLVDRDDVDFA